MDLTLSESERIVQQRARDLLSREITADLLNGIENQPFPEATWDVIRAQGWFGLAVPESEGGAGGSLTEWVLTLEELGRAGTPGPVTEQLTLTAALAQSREGASSRFTLARLISGAAVGTIAVTDLPGTSPSVTGTGPGLAHVTAEKVVVPWGERADVIAVRVPATSGHDVHVVVERAGGGISGKPSDSLSGNRMAHLSIATAPASLLPESSAGDPRAFAALHLLARDAYALGIISRMMEMASNYAANRVQFGQPIGSFQAIQHRAAEMALAVYAARILLYQSAWLAEQRRPGSQADMAHSYMRDAAGEVCTHAHQMHGAIGMTAEYPLQYFSRRAKAYQNSLGTATQFREQVATAVWGAGRG